MVVLKSIGVMAAAKMAAVLALIVSLIEVVIILIFYGAFTALFGPSPGSHGIWVTAFSPIIAVVVGFFATAIMAWLYNVVAGRFGGVSMELKKNELRSIEPVSFGKIYAVMLAIVVFVCALIFGVIGAALASAFGVSSLAVVAIIALIIILPVLALIVGFVCAAIFALVYNFVASRIGGIKLYFNGDELKNVGILSYAKILAVFGAIIGLIYGAVFTFAIAVGGSYMSSGAVTPSVFHSLGVFAIILFPILFCVLEFVVAAFESFVYNKIAPSIGGIRLKFSKK